MCEKKNVHLFQFYLFPKREIKIPANPGVNFIKVQSWAFFIEIALSIWALRLGPTFNATKSFSKVRLRFAPRTQLYEIDPRLDSNLRP